MMTTSIENALGNALPGEFRLRAVAVVPVFNPEPGLVPLVQNLAAIFGRVIVVDDGSIEHTDDFSLLPDSVTVLRHAANKGKGRAIKTAIEWVKANEGDADVVVFADGDGQHRPDDVRKVAEHAAECGRVTLGVRDFSRSGVPFRSRFGNVVTSFLVRLMYRIPIYDTQTGLRAIPRRLFDAMLETPGERYEYEMRLFGMLRENNEALEQIPIETVYVDGNRASHFNPILDSFRVYRGLFGDTFPKFCASSVLGFLADNGIFTFFLFCLQDLGWLRRYDILASLVVARIVSATFNYLCNKIFVFKSRVKLAPSFARYWSLVLLVALLSYAGTAGLSAAVDATGWSITAIKVVVETVLFIVSYRCQKRWVFKEENS